MNALVGTRALVRLALRRDRILVPVWVLALSAVILLTASALQQLYPTLVSRQELAIGVAGNPAVIALTGPPFDLSTIGGLTAWRIGGVIIVLIGLMSLLLVNRHTRAEEETGRLELLEAGVVGRYAGLTAGLLVSCGASLAIGLLVALGLIRQGLPATGSFAFGLGLAGAGWVFSAVAAVTAQLTEGARAANGIAATVLGASFLLRAVGDTAGDNGLSWLSWISPIGWVQQVRSFSGERWWVFGLTAGLFVVLVATAYVLVGRRDFGAGVLPPRPGPAHAARWLSSPEALAWRLHRGLLLGWAVGFAVLGAAVGSIAAGVGDLLNTSPQLKEAFDRLGGQGGIVDAYLVSVISVMGLVASVYAVQATLRLRSEETSLRAEPVLSTAVGRVRWALSHVAIAALGTAALLVVGGAAAGLAHGARISDVGGQVPRLIGAALVQIPAAWVLAGIAVALFGLAPRLTVAAWGALVVFLLIGQLGPILQLEAWIMDISPFTHVPKIPGGTLSAAPLVALVAVALALGVAGLVGFRRRDVG